MVAVVVHLMVVCYVVDLQTPMLITYRLEDKVTQWIVEAVPMFTLLMLILGVKLLLKIGIKGRFVDIQGNLIKDVYSGQEIYDLSSDVLLDDDNLNIIHNEENEKMFFKDMNPPTYNICSIDDNNSTEITTKSHDWKVIDGLYLIPGDTYDYILSYTSIDFTVNEPFNPDVFEKYISSSNGISSISNIPVKKSFIYEYIGDNTWIEHDPLNYEYEYITKYHYTGIDIFPIFSYPGSSVFSSDNFNSLITEDYKNYLIDKFLNMGYDDQISFINGDKDSPFESGIYTYNNIIWNTVENDERGSVDSIKKGLYDEKMNNENNPHLESFTKISCYVTYNNDSGNRWSKIQSLQHESPEKLDSSVGKFLNRFLDKRLWYYRNNLSDEYNNIKKLQRINRDHLN